jgi:hypothetical protein
LCVCERKYFDWRAKIRSDKKIFWHQYMEAVRYSADSTTASQRTVVDDTDDDDNQDAANAT